MNKVAHYNGFVGRCQQYGLTKQAADMLYKKPRLTKSAQSITGYVDPAFNRAVTQFGADHPTAAKVAGGVALAVPTALTAPLWMPALATVGSAAGPALAAGAGLATRYGKTALDAAKRYGPAAYNATINAAKTYGPAALNATKRYGATALNGINTYGSHALRYGGKVLSTIPRFGWKVLNYGTSNIVPAMGTFASRTLRGMANFTPKQFYAPIYSKINGTPVGLIPGLQGAASKIMSAYNFAKHPVESSISTISTAGQLKTIYNYRDKIRDLIVNKAKAAWPFFKDGTTWAGNVTLAANEIAKGGAEARRGELNNETIEKAREYNQNANNTLKKYVHSTADYSKGVATNQVARVGDTAKNKMFGVGTRVEQLGKTLQNAAHAPAQAVGALVDTTSAGITKKIDDASNEIDKKLDVADNALQATNLARNGASPVSVATAGLGFGNEPLRAVDPLYLDKIPYIGGLLARGASHLTSPLIYGLGRPVADWMNYSRRVPKEEQSILGRADFIAHGIYDELFRKGLPPTQEQL